VGRWRFLPAGVTSRIMSRSPCRGAELINDRAAMPSVPAVALSEWEATSRLRREGSLFPVYFPPTTEQRYTWGVATSVISGLAPAAAAWMSAAETNW
jgi:hypothetical protein